MSRYLCLYLIPAAFTIAGYVASIPLAPAGPNANTVLVAKTPLVQTLPGESHTPPAAADQDNNMQTNPLIEQAINDLAQRKSISHSMIKVVSYEEVTWSDTSLGCPHPDMRYLQVPQDGARIILQINDRVYVYHSGGSRLPFLCTKPVQMKSPSSPSGVNQ